jgi:hypothetical protein
MERLTTNKSVADMSMIELAHNSCYVDDEGNARYRDYEMEMDARDFARNLMVTLAKDELPVDDAEYESIGTPEECRAAMEKQIVEKELESHDEKYILKYCISLMQELVGKFEEWYEYVHGEDAIRELDEVERFYYRMSYFSIVQELFLFRTSHSGGTSTRAKCKQLGVDWRDGIEFSFGGDEE